MSDQSQGPGWWLASDGRWYPPETPPATGVTFPPPVGPAWTPESGSAAVTPGPGVPGEPRGATPGTTAAIVIGGLLTLVIVGLLIAGLLGKDDKSDVATDLTVDTGAVSTVDELSTTTTDGAVTTATTTATTAPPVVAVPADFKTVTDDIAGFSIAVPPSWLAVPIHGDVAGLGDRYAPDDSALAAAIDNGIGALPRQVVLFGLDADAAGATFGRNLNVISLPRDTATLADLAAQAGQAVEVLGAVDVAVQELTVLAGPAVRVDYRLGGSSGLNVRGEQYYVLAGERIWIVTFATILPGPDPFDQMMASFRVNG